MQWLVIKCLEWKIYTLDHGQIDTQELVSTGWFWGRERGPGYWLMWMEGAGVIWTASGSGIADQTQRHDLWDVINDIFLIVDHITHSLWSMKTTGCLKEMNGKSQKYWYMKETKGESEMWAKKFSENELFTHLKGLPIFVYFIYKDDKTLLWVLLPDKRIKESNKFFHKMGSDLQRWNQTPNYWGISGFYPVCWLSQCYLGQPPQGEFSHAEKFI